MQVGTSGYVYPAASFGQILASRNVPVVEVNIDETGGCPVSSLYFRGKAGEVLPKLLEWDQFKRILGGEKKTNQLN